MRWTTLRRALLPALGVAALALAGCGGDDDGAATSADNGAGVSGPLKPVEGQKRGGHLTILSAGDVDNIDPGAAYYSFTYQVLMPTLRPLYSLPPDSDGTKVVPDLADGDPEVSADGKTVTVKIKRGIRYSPPYGKEVTAKDVKYAIERAFTPAVPNGYVGAYFANIVGVKAFQDGKADGISGISTPDDSTIVFRLTEGDIVGALVLPVTSPVPEEYAKRFDSAKGQSTYGRNQVSPGPYMIRGYRPGKSIEIVRNPNWDADNDDRPAYLDRVTFAQGFDDPSVATRRILNGRSQVSGDFMPPPDQLRRLATGDQKDQLIVSPGAGVEFMSVNTTIKPLDNADVRRAIAAALDREGLLRVRGGRFLGQIASHMLYPTVQGFDEAGGIEGGGQDFYAAPSGDMAVAEKYMKRAGYASGRYEGDETFLMVGVSTGSHRRQAEIAERSVEKLGFDVTLRLVSMDTMYGICTTPKQKAAFCPNVQWTKDYADAGAILNPLYNPDNIVPEGNTVLHQYKGSNLGPEIKAANALPAGQERIDSWAAIDRKVSDLALNIPFIWDSSAVVASKNVQMVNQLWNQGSVDYAWTSLK